MKRPSLADKMVSFLQQRPLFLLLLLLEIALVFRLLFALWMEYPGISDPLHYYLVSRNLASGRGFQVDYIWHYLTKPEHITHSSNDYWMPLAAILTALPQLILGQSLVVALIPAILCGVGLSVLTYYLAKACSRSHFAALYSAGLVFLLPPLFLYSLQTDTPIYYAFFIALSLFGMIRGADDPRFFLLAAAGAGLAHLTRADGVLLLPTLLLVVLLSAQRPRTRLTYFLLALLVYLLVLSPWLLSNWQTFGSLIPPGVQKTVFLTDYMDIFSYSKELSLHSFLAWGIGNILASRVQMVFFTLKTLYELFGPLLCVFALVGLFDLLRRPEGRARWRSYFPPLLFGGLLLAFYILVAPFVGQRGSFAKSALALTPYLAILTATTVERRVPSRAAATLILLLLAAFLLFESLSFAGGTMNANAAWNQQMVQIRQVLRSQGQSDIVVMTCYPWDINYVTGYEAVQIPNDDLETVYEVAQRYRANYLLLPAPWEEVTALYEGRISDSRFVFVAQIPNSEWKIFRIELNRAPLQGATAPRERDCFLRTK